MNEVEEINYLWEKFQNNEKLSESFWKTAPENAYKSMCGLVLSNLTLVNCIVWGRVYAIPFNGILWLSLLMIMSSVLILLLSERIDRRIGLGKLLYSDYESMIDKYKQTTEFIAQGVKAVRESRK